MKEKTSSVFAAIVGRPNVGKSSLLNRLVGEKAAIVTPKPQTTRTKITGILTQGPVQFVFIDTPGIHHPRTKLGQKMAQTANETAAEGDVALMLFEPAGEMHEAEQEMMAALRGGNALGVINKADTVRKGEELALRHARLMDTGVFREVHVISAKTGEGCDELLRAVAGYAVEGPHYFADDMYTDQPEKQLLAEIVREKLLLHMQEEIPHGTAVEVERFHERDDGLIEVDVVIYCERKTHKGMIIGKGGQMLKRIASEARGDAQQLLGAQIHMQTWVKVREGWRDNDNWLGRMGFGKG